MICRECEAWERRIYWPDWGGRCQVSHQITTENTRCLAEQIREWFEQHKGADEPKSPESIVGQQKE